MTISEKQPPWYLFLIGCIGVRLLMVYIAKKYTKDYSIMLAAAGAAIGMGFLFLFITKTREDKGAFNNKIWWGNLRPVHSILYLSFAFLVVKKNENAYVPLLIDVIIGLVMYLHRYYL